MTDQIQVFKERRDKFGRRLLTAEGKAKHADARACALRHVERGFICGGCPHDRVCGIYRAFALRFRRNQRLHDPDTWLRVMGKPFYDREPDFDGPGRWAAWRKWRLEGEQK